MQESAKELVRQVLSGLYINHISWGLRTFGKDGQERRILARWSVRYVTVPFTSPETTTKKPEKKSQCLGDRGTLIPKGPCHRAPSFDRSAKPCWSSAKAFVEECQQTSEDNTEETELARGTLKNLEIVEHARQAVFARGRTPGRGDRPCRHGRAFDLDNNSIAVPRLASRRRP